MAITINGTGTISGLTTTGISAVQKLPAGTVLQVVTGFLSTETTVTNTNFTSTGLTATITPSSTTSKILIICSLGDIAVTYASGGNAMKCNLTRNGSQVGAQFGSQWLYINNNTGTYIGPAAFTYTDSPSSTSALTYLVNMGSTNGLSTVKICRDNTQATITLMEIAQ